MKKLFQNLILIILILITLTSCAGNGTVTPEPPGPVQEDYVYLDVPYVKQATDIWCLPASGAMVFKYYGLNISQEEIAPEVMVAPGGLGSGSDLVRYAQELGFESWQKNLFTYDIKMN